MNEPDADDSIDPTAWRKNYDFHVRAKINYHAQTEVYENWLQDLLMDRLITDVFLDAKTGHDWYFKRLDDATAFKMRWG
ncbi:MAG: hypothetical protein EOP83_35060 [Verrucomicrobiaceae bacterium]|nr:MAG: hypothetical protein EOP83_35060 [Verrucomicrobiaceae bacterium]